MWAWGDAAEKLCGLKNVLSQIAAQSIIIVQNIT